MKEHNIHSLSYIFDPDTDATPNNSIITSIEIRIFHYITLLFEMLFIKNTTTDDIPLIRKLALQIWPSTYTPIIGEKQVTYMLDLFYNDEVLKKQLEELEHHFIICYNNEFPIAFASFSEIDDKIFKLHKLYILPSEQGKGIGSHMIDHVVDLLKKLDAEALHLNVNRYNFSAISFYKKIGFQYIFDEDVDIGMGYYMNDHVFELVIQ